MLLWLAACAPLSPPTISVAAEVPTVVTAAWGASVPGRTRVVVDLAGEPTYATAWEEQELSHLATVLGLVADTEYTAWVEAEDGSRSDPTSFLTGSLVPGVPAPTVTGTPAWEPWLVTCFSGAAAGPLVLDAAGQVVWAVVSPDASRVTRTRIRPDGQGVWYGYAESEAKDLGGLVSVAWTGEELDRIEAPAFSHDFVQLPDGRLAWIEYDRRNVADRPVWGNRLVAGDADGAEVLWSAFDTWDPTVHGDVAEDGYWTGINAVDHDVATDTFTLGSRGLGALVDVDATTGEVTVQLGGPTSDYTFVGDDAELSRNHQFQKLDGAVLVHDNRDESSGSRVVELTVDEAARTATATWSWQHDPPLFVYALGDVHRHDDGGTLVTWSTAGVIDDLGADDTVLATATLPLGSVFGFLEPVDTLPGMQAP